MEELELLFLGSRSITETKAFVVIDNAISTAAAYVKLPPELTGLTFSVEPRCSFIW
jgi:hypothetical protein